MKIPPYIQIDNSIFGDAKVAVLMRKHGAIGLAVFVYSLIQLNEKKGSGISIDRGFKDCAAVMLNLSHDDIDLTIGEIIALGLLYCEDGEYYSKGYISRTGAYLDANKKRSETQKKNHQAKESEPEQAPEPEPEPEPEKKPVKEKPKKEPDHTQEIVDFWNAKADKGKCTKITGDIKKAIAKRLAEYSLDEIKGTISNYQAVVQDQTCFFSYVWNIYEFFKRDNAFLAFTGDESVLLRYQKGGNMQPPEPEPQVKAWVVPEWKSDNPKPDNYDNWDERQYNAYWIDCTKERSRTNTTSILEALKAKAEKEKQEAAEEAERLRWKHPFPKPEFWDGMKREAQEAYIRKHTDQEAAQ